jgi:glutamate synthase domain-containing protein 3
VRALVAEHWTATGSARARTVLADWDRYRPLFLRVEPRGAAAHVAALKSQLLATPRGG